MSRIPAIGFGIVIAVPLAAQNGAARTGDPTVPAAIAAIRESDLRRDLFTLAGDDMRGREAGTLDELRASMWIAEQMRRIGVQPAGEKGSWFQWWQMRQTRISTPVSSVRIADRALNLWTDITPTNNATGDITATTAFVNDVSDSTVDIRGKVAVAALVAPPPASIRTTTNTYKYNYARAALTAQGGALTRRGAAAVILVADSIAESVFQPIAIVQQRGMYDVIGGAPRFVRTLGVTPPANPPVRPVPVLLAHHSALAELRVDGTPVEIHIRPETFATPSVNIIGVVRGTDPKLRDEYVLFSAHQDHDGVRYPVAGDSIWNGADDNGSTSVALLAIARAFVKQPARRSALFVFHGAEERGLLGSRYHAVNPVVPLDKIVAVLNGDMIGRNNPDTAALLGSQPPHRNSLALVNIALDANRAVSPFVIDSSWDRPNHPEGWYFRSDHVPYAERKVAAVYFSTLLHSDYHTPRDEPQRIDYAKLTRMAKWMYLTGWNVANARTRPPIDSGFVLR
jgi:hypothetical protein